MIKSFKCGATESVFQGSPARKFPAAIQNTARRKLRMVHAAVELLDLRVPPGNRLEALKAGRKGQHSIRINDQYRVCFIWKDNHAYEVEIVDYH